MSAILTVCPRRRVRNSDFIRYRFNCTTGSETISDEEMEELRREAKAKLDAIFGTVPPSNEDEDDDDGEAFQLATPEAIAAEEAAELAAEAEEAEM